MEAILSSETLVITTALHGVAIQTMIHTANIIFKILFVACKSRVVQFISSLGPKIIFPIDPRAKKPLLIL
jgi:hypothetical protein